MERLRTLTAKLTGHPHWCAAGLGGIAACGFQPLGLWPLTLIAAALLIELVARADSWKRAALVGWVFGLAHFTLGNNWIATSFTYQAKMPGWLGWVGVVLISAYIAVYPALGSAAAWSLAKIWRNRVADPETSRRFIGLALVPGWIVSEWLRSWVFTGFAWNPLGAVLLGPYDAQGLALLAPWTGTYGLSGIAVALAAALRFAARQGGRSLGLCAAGFAALAALMHLPARYLPPQQGGISVTLVQPDIRQEVINDPAWYETNFRKTAALSTPAKQGQHRLVLWPESGIPDYLREGYGTWHYQSTTFAADPALARLRVAKVIGPRALLISGSVDLVMQNGEAVAARNVATAINDRGEIVASYAKAHLVPYGEYLALRWLLEPLGVTRLVPGAMDFLPGPGPRSFDFGRWGKAGVQVCYEIVFSGQVVDRTDRPDFLFNPTNDGWFGAWGPPQHLAQARLRAIEEGLPVLRATTTGISAIIDADGIVRRHLPRHTAGRIDSHIPYAHPPTLFAQVGNLLPLLWALAIAVLTPVAFRRMRR